MAAADELTGTRTNKRAPLQLLAGLPTRSDSLNRLLSRPARPSSLVIVEGRARDAIDGLALDLSGRFALIGQIQSDPPAGCPPGSSRSALAAAEVSVNVRREAHQSRPAALLSSCRLPPLANVARRRRRRRPRASSARKIEIEQLNCWQSRPPVGDSHR